MKQLIVNTELVKITPQIAEAWLSDIFGEQRTLRQGHVDKLKLDMTEGNFHVSPDAILRIKGKLANGQHRLRAVVESGKPQLFIVMTSNDEELYKVVDCGLRRTVADSLRGLLHAKDLPSVARWVILYDSGCAQPSAVGATEGMNNSRSATKSHLAMVEYCNDRIDVLTEAVEFVSPMYQKFQVLQKSISGSLYVIASERDSILSAAKTFLGQLYSDGGGATPVRNFRKRLLANRCTASKMKAGMIFGLMLRAFVQFQDGSETRLAVSSGDPWPRIM